MAKATQQTTKGKAPTGKDVATRGASTQVESSADNMAALEDMMLADAGKGVSTAVEDNVVPLIYVLQALSPQVNKKKEEYVPGAEAGMIWFRGTKTVVKGDEGILVAACDMIKTWIEWQPNRGGFVERHADRPADAVQVTDAQNPKKKFWQRKNGNTVTETREHVVIVLDVFDHPQAFVIPMSGSGHGASRDWTTKMNNMRVEIKGQMVKPSAWTFLYRMKLKFMSNDQGDWYMWDIDHENGEPTKLNDPEVYLMARQIQDDFAKGKKKAAAVDDQGQLDDTGTDGGTGTNARGERQTARASEVL